MAVQETLRELDELRERLDEVPKDKAVLYIGNHCSFFDIVIAYSQVPGITGFISKKEVKKAEENHCYVVDDGIAVFAVRVRERFMYDYYRDTPELKQIIFDDLCKRAAQDLIGSGKYEIIQTAAMSTVDVKPLIAARKKLDGR